MPSMKISRAGLSLLPALLAVILLMFSGCSTEEKGNNVQTLKQATQSAESGFEQSAVDGSEAYAEILNSYLKQYGTANYWCDAYLQMKYLILSDNELVILLALPEAPQTTVIPYSSVSRYETTSVGTVTVFTVIDHAGNKTTINLSVEDATKVEEELSAHI